MSPRAATLVAGTLALAILTVPAQAATVKISISNVAYAPLEAKAKVGDTIEWTNADIVVHSVTARDKSFDLNLFPKRSGKITVKAAGTIDYYCRYHPNMVGKIVVSP
jgi:plastocyanin